MKKHLLAGCLLGSAISLTFACGGKHDRVLGDSDQGAGDTNEPGDSLQPGDVQPGDIQPGDPGGNPGSGVLLITEILDGPLTGGLPKFVEITNIGSESANLTAYSLGVFVNGNTHLRSPFLDTVVSQSLMLSGNLSAGASYIVNFENGDTPGTSAFRDVYGFDPDHYEFDAVFNGDDAIVLFVGAATDYATDATTVDSFGQVGMDGTGALWDYIDSRAARRGTVTAPPSATNDPTAFGFVAAEWDCLGPDALDGMDEIGIAGTSSPGFWP